MESNSGEFDDATINASVGNILIVFRLVEIVARWRENEKEKAIITATISEIGKSFRTWRKGRALTTELESLLGGKLPNMENEDGSN